MYYIIYFTGCIAAFIILRKSGNHLDLDDKTEWYIFMDYILSFGSWLMFLLVFFIYNAARCGEEISGIKFKKSKN